jgi:hypothetical protein
VPKAGRRKWALLAVLAATLAYAAPLPNLGWNQGSHYALVEALDRGDARIDRFRWQTGDVSWFDGHYYSTKAPGLSLAALPPYAALEATGVADLITDNAANRWEAARYTIWWLSFWTVALPAAILLLLVRALADQIEPGFGTATALTLGLGTLVLPFATLFFSHVLSACLGFGAFALLWHERASRARLLLVGAAGLLVGLSVTVEYSLGIMGLALGIYALIGRTAKLKRALAYLAGAIAGVIPLAIYNQLAFGSVTHLSYADAVKHPGRSGHAVLGANSSGFFGVDVPNPRVFLDLLLSSRGLLILTPVLAMGVVGLVTMYRRGWRAETFTISFVVLAFLLFNAGYWLPYGGGTPGPRLLVPALPFIALPLAAAYRRYPSCTIGLAAASVVTMVTATATKPLLPGANTGSWVSHVVAGDFQYTLALQAGVHNRWLMVIPFLVPVAAALVFTVLATPRPAIEPRETRIAFAAILGWAIVAAVVPRLLRHVPPPNAIILVAVAAGIAAAVVAAWALASRVKRIELAAPVSEP